MPAKDRLPSYAKHGTPMSVIKSKPGGALSTRGAAFTSEATVAAPRIHHQWSPGELMFEKSLPLDLRAAFECRGHKLKELPSMAVSQIVARDVSGKGFVGAADPRAGGNAAGW